MGWWNKLVRDKKEKEMNKQQTWTVEVIKDGKTEELVIVAGVPTFKLKKKEQLTNRTKSYIIVYNKKAKYGRRETRR